MATSFSIEISQLPGDETFTALMDGIGVRLADIVPMYDALYATFRKIEQKRFDAEGPGWMSLAPSTVTSRGGSDHPILNRKGLPEQKGRTGGQLRKSLTTKGAKNAVVEPLPDGLFMGTSDPVARYHQDGTQKMPARPVVDMTEADAEAFSEVISAYLFEFGLEGGRATSADQMFTADAIGL